MNNIPGRNIDWYSKLKGTPYKTPHELVSAIYAETDNLYETAERLGVAYKTAQYWLQKTKWANRGTNKYRVAEMADRIPQMTTQEIAAEVGCSHHTVRYLCQRLGINAKNMGVGSNRNAPRHIKTSTEDEPQMAGPLNGYMCKVCGVPLRGAWMHRCPVHHREHLRNQEAARGLDPMDYRTRLNRLAW